MNSFSGAENVAITICRNFKDNYECAYASPDGEIREWVEKEHITYLPMDKFSTKEFKRIVKEFHPDIVHAHDFSASVMAASQKKRFHLISHLHNNPPWIRKVSLKSLIYQFYKRKIDHIFLVSDAIQKEAVFLGKMDKHVQVIGNPIDNLEILKKSKRFKVSKFDLLFIGRFTEQKNPKCFLKIVKKLDDENLDLSAVMIGDGELFEKCKYDMNKLGISDRITCEGFQKNPYPYIKQAKILLVTSKWEGYGLIAREALVLGTPVLAMDVGGLHSIFEKMPQALCKTEAEMRKKADILLKNVDIYSKYKEKIKNLQKTMMTLSEYLEQIDKTYKELAR